MIGNPIKQSLLNSEPEAPHTKFIGKINNQISNAKKGVFLFNIESYQELNEGPKSASLDALFSVAAGFKPYRILLEKGFNADTEMVFFDYSLKALEVKKFIVEHWDGFDFPGFVRTLFKEYPHPEVFYQLWDNTHPSNLDWQDMELMWQAELKKWGGEQAFSEHWAHCRLLKHSYIHCDLLQNRQPLLKKMSEFNNSYIWWSNAFFTIFSHWHFDAIERKQQYLEWVEAVAEAAPLCEISGADHNNSAVNGLSAGQYNQLLDKERCDQLMPQQLHTAHMQF